VRCRAARAPHGGGRLAHRRIGRRKDATLLLPRHEGDKLFEFVGRVVADARSDRRPLHHVAHDLPDQVLLGIEALEAGQRPAVHLRDRIDRFGIEPLARPLVRMLDRFAKQRILRTEVPEQRDLVEVRLLRDPARRGSMVARLGVHTSGYLEQFLPGIDTHGRLQYCQL
jgi:hypothetical protein